MRSGSEDAELGEALLSGSDTAAGGVGDAGVGFELLADVDPPRSIWDVLGEIGVAEIEQLKDELKPLLAFCQINASFETNFVVPFPVSASEIFS
eukprot:6809048-Prymnesium_polylepis.1